MVTAIAGVANGSEIKASEEISVSTTNELLIYPNPANGAFTVQSVSGGIYYIMSPKGELIRSFELNEKNNFKTKISGLVNGLYIVVGQNQNGISKQKVVVGAIE